MPFGDPGNGLNVTQASWRGFDIGFQCVINIVIFLVPGLLLLDFGLNKLFDRPDASAADGLLHLRIQLIGTGQGSRFH